MTILEILLNLIFIRKGTKKSFRESQSLAGCENEFEILNLLAIKYPRKISQQEINASLPTA